jgi:hypothetical protein
MLQRLFKQNALFADGQNLLEFPGRYLFGRRGEPAVKLAFLVNPVFDGVHVLAMAVMDIDLSAAGAVVGLDNWAEVFAVASIHQITIKSRELP